MGKYLTINYLTINYLILLLFFICLIIYGQKGIESDKIMKYITGLPY